MSEREWRLLILKLKKINPELEVRLQENARRKGMPGQESKTTGRK